MNKMTVKSAVLKEHLAAHALDVHLTNLLVGIGAGVEVPMITILGRRVGLVPSETANVVSLSALCRTIIDIPCGVIVEWVGVRKTMVSCLLINAGASLLGLQVDGLLSLALYSALSGISLGGFFLARHIFVAGILSKRYRGTLMSLLSGLLRLAHVIGPAAAGLVVKFTGDVRFAFILPLLAALTAVVCLLVSATPRYHRHCEHSCTISPSPCSSEEEKLVGSVTGSREDDVEPAEKERAAGAVSAHMGLGSGEEHYFLLASVWQTLVRNRSVIWRLGLYTILFVALRANRKLMLVFAAMRMALSDAQVSFLLSFSFAFDALLFPLGGILMDVCGRRFAMVPVTAGLGLIFFLLPLCQTRGQLYAIAALFGTVDALGCGLVMTITADRAPVRYGAPFFGIMRTLQDLGHVMGAASTALLLQYVEFQWCCYVLAAEGMAAAAWGLWGVPQEEHLLDTPRPPKRSSPYPPHHGEPNECGTMVVDGEPGRDPTNGYGTL